MNWAEAEAFITSHFLKKWAGRTPVKIQNVDDPQFPIKDGRPWILIYPLYVSADSSMGRTKIYHHTAGIAFTLFCEKGKGTAESNKYFMEAVKLFRDKTINGMTFHNILGQPKRLEVENYFRFHFTIPCFFDEIVNPGEDDIDSRTDLNFYSAANSGNTLII